MKTFIRFVSVALAYLCVTAAALAQTPGTITNHAFAIGKGAGNTGFTPLLCGAGSIAIGQAGADPICQSVSGDITISAAGVAAIGANKVINSMFATMAANTTKCNSTAGSAVPTDCTASTMRANIGAVIGTNVEAWDADLDCLASNSTAGLLTYTGAGTCAARALTAPAAGFTITNPSGTAGNPTFVLANDLAALEGLSSTGIARRTGTDAWSVGTLVSNAELATAGAATLKGNPTASTASVQDFTIQGLTARGAPDAANDKLPIYDNAAGTIKYVTPSQIAGASSGTVTSVTGNGVTFTTSGTIPPPYGLVNHSLSVSASAGALTINLLDNAGSTPSATSPVNGYFRNSGATGNGSWTQLAVTAALSLTIPSGATMNVTSSTAFRLWVVLFNDGGTARLGVINCSDAGNIYPLVEGQLASSTALSAASNSGGVFYTGVAATTKAFLIVGYVEWSATGLTAGTWTTTNLLYIQSFGPGIKKPGDVIQIATTSLNTAATLSSTSYTATSLTKTPTLSSAANMVKVSMSGAFTANVNGKRTYIQVFRNAAAAPNGPEKTAFIATGAAAISDVNIMFLDRPNGTGPTYAVYGKIDAAGGGNFPDGTNTTNAQLILEEIMG